MREVAETVRRGRDADALQEIHRSPARFLTAHAEVRPQRLGELVAYGEHRVQRGHRILEDEPYLGAAHAPQVLRIELHQVFAVEAHPA